MVRVMVDVTAGVWRDCLREAREANTTLPKWAGAVLADVVKKKKEDGR